MAGMVEHLSPVIPVRHEREAGANADHPMRQVTRQVAFEPGGWTPERSAKVADLFDGLAPEWHTRDAPGRYDALHDALDRAEIRGGAAIELGSGSGLSTPLLAERFDRLVAMDLSMEMLRLAPADAAPRVQVDSSRLPLVDDSVAVVLLINMLLFPDEVARVLAPDGALVWVNTSGDRTPIHLPADDVVAAMPGAWQGKASEAGTGTWCVLRRGD